MHKIQNILNKIHSENIKFDVVLFHNPCQDGMLSFSLLYHYRKEWFDTENLDVIPTNSDISYNPKIHYKRYKNKKILILDLNISNEFFIFKIHKLANYILLIDHHKEKINYEKYNIDVVLNEKYSTCMTIYCFFLKKEDRREEIPLLLHIVDDRDTHKNKNELKDIGSKFYRSYEVYLKDNDTIENTSIINPDAPNKISIINQLKIVNIIQNVNLLISLVENENKLNEFLKHGEYFEMYYNMIFEKSKNNYEIITNFKGVGNEKYNILVCNASGFVAKMLASRLQTIEYKNKTVDLIIIWSYHIKKKKERGNIHIINCICRSHFRDITWLLNKYNASGHKKAGSFFYKASNIYDFIYQHNKSQSNVLDQK